MPGAVALVTILGAGIVVAAPSVTAVHTAPITTVRGQYENGAREYERHYRNGRAEGVHRGWYRNGALALEYHYHNGLSEGSQRQWYPNGRPFASFTHHLGHEIGQQQLWNPDGTVRSNYVIRDGRRYGLLGAVGCTGRGKLADTLATDRLP